MKSIHKAEYKEIIVRLVQARKDAHITQQDLAKKLGKHQSYVSKYEIGERRLDIAEFLEIAGIVGVDYKDIIDI